jgi:predicted membrane metal-binding protein
MLSGATPPWFAENVVAIAVVLLLGLMYLVVRLVHKVALRATLLGVLAALAVFVYVNRAPLQACARTCECSLAGRDITVPVCDPDLEL